MPGKGWVEPMPPPVDSSRNLLDAVYDRLGFAEGDLLEATDRPTKDREEDWIDKGEWLALAKRIGAERVFFVDNNPVVVFAVDEEDDPARWLHFFNRVWCMARPQMLFLARPGELSVYNLTKRPPRNVEESERQEWLLEIVNTAAEVQSKLKRYRRDQVESGHLFEDERFGFGDRADHALVRDLATVRKGLIDKGLSVQHAHALIGRSIFIRYLEDRRVLLPEYFDAIAEGNEPWQHILATPPACAHEFFEGCPLYLRVLSDKGFTYALFRKLAGNFNGDMFPIDPDEERSVTADHLRELQKFLLGNAEDQLFFFAYRFDIIPIELISSIYEEFYSVESGKKPADGSYYTPSALVEFVLSHVLTKEVLNRKPRVMDPACGSGIFLVESFRRIVRHRVSQFGRRLRPGELRKILREQIAGIDINPEAVRVAAFSLYLALLHYQEPPDILHKRLPSLTYCEREDRDPALHYDILVAADAFHVEDVIQEDSIRSRFSTGCVEVVVGNPPWGDPTSQDEFVKSGRRGALKWCKEHGKAVGNNELSQAFIHKTLDLLKDGGWAGLLVSTGVFFKRAPKSREFREQWLPNVSLRRVVNFAAVRDTFFSGPNHKKGAIAPFASIVFQKRAAVNDHRFAYWSAKETAFIERVQAVILSRADLSYVWQRRFEQDDELWKVYWWGGHRDEVLIQGLRAEDNLGDVIHPEEDRLRVGFKVAKKDQPADWLANYRVLPTDAFCRYGPLPQFEDVPPRVHRRGDESVYNGLRLLIGRGIEQKNDARGRITARLESTPFCFKDSIYGLPLEGKTQEEGKVLLGILWSSLVRYYQFMTSGTWGMWHHELKKDAIHSIPVHLPTTARARQRVTEVVDKLRALETGSGGWFSGNGHAGEDRSERVEDLEAKLDDAIFALYGLSEEEKDLIRDLCDVGLDLFYRGRKSAAVAQVVAVSGNISFGRRKNVPTARSRQKGLDGYLDAFLSIWEPKLAEMGGRFRWRLIRPDGESPMLAVIFSTESDDDLLPDPSDTAEQAWQDALERLGEVSMQPFDAKRIYIDGITRIVTPTDIVIIKRNELRFWTRSAAREDAEATMLHALHRSMATEEEGVSSASP
jgi:N-6 DNA Methylase